MNRKKVTKSLSSLLAAGCLLLACAALGVMGQGGAKSEAQPKSAANKPAPADEVALRSRLDEILKLPAWERVAELEDFLDQVLPDAVELRAVEHMVSSLAAFGDERLQANDTARGLQLFREAVRVAPDDMSDRLFVEVVSQFPANLYLRGQREAAFELMGRIERRVAKNPRRLLALMPFYLSMERAGEAARVASAAVKLAPEMPAAHLALGAALRQSLRLEEAEREYARALELDPKSTVARQSLADMRRAAGRAPEALTLYRELLAADPKNAAARSGVVLSLFDAGRRQEAEAELEAALKDDPKNLPLLAGAAYWHAARGDATRALDLAERAVNVEPRHPWAQVALGRALVAAKRPLDAERVLRFARVHSNFPTLDYELANALAAAGLYDEAAELLASRFTLKGGRLSTRLAGRVDATGESFVELLAPERRASFFQAGAADTEENARRLKSLLALHAATQVSGEAELADPSALTAAAESFARGEDEMRAFRQLHAANRLLRRRSAVPAALALVEAARKSVDAGLDAPQAPAAAMADELRDLRERAIRQGATPALPDIPRNLLSNIVRGRIEEAHGWALFNQGKIEEAVASLRAALTVLPESSAHWRSAQWRLGVALASSGNNREALASYIKAYDPNRPDPARRSVIVALYRKVHGSTTGIDLRLPSAAPTQPAQAVSQQMAAATATPAPEVKVDDAKRDAATPEEETKKSDAASATPAPMPEATPSPEPTAPPEARPAREESAATPAAKPAETKSEELAAATSGAPARRGRTRTSLPLRQKCTLSVSEAALSLAGGGSVTVVARLEGGGDPALLTATTPNWSDIIILREPAGDAGPDAARFTVSSISKTPGSYTVALKSPCGAKEIGVTVK